MFRSIIRPLAYFGPVLFLTLAITGILLFHNYTFTLSIPQLPYWNFSAPDSFDLARARTEELKFAGFRDPFGYESRTSSMPFGAPEFHLTMVIRGSKACCMINGKLYFINDEGPGFIVVGIGTNWAELKREDGSIQRIFLNGSGAERQVKEGS